MNVLAPVWLEVLVVVLLGGRVAVERWLRVRAGRDLSARARRPVEFLALLLAGVVGVALLRAGATGTAAVWLAVVVVADTAWEYAHAEVA